MQKEWHSATKPLSIISVSKTFLYIVNEFVRENCLSFIMDQKITFYWLIKGYIAVYKEYHLCNLRQHFNQKAFMAEKKLISLS
jgi:hypothetical protein